MNDTRNEVPSTSPVRVLLREVPGPGETAEIGEASFDDALSIATARKARPGGYLRLPFSALKAIGKSMILLEKAVQGTDLVLRVRLFPTPAHARR